MLSRVHPRGHRLHAQGFGFSKPDGSLLYWWLDITPVLFRVRPHPPGYKSLRYARRRRLAYGKAGISWLALIGRTQAIPRLASGREEPAHALR